MPEPTNNNRRDFSRSKRLLNGRDFQTVFEGVRYKIGHSHMLLLATPNSNGHARLGLVIAKKNVRRAVGRNRIKRVAREYFRLNLQQIASLDIVLLARRGIVELDRRQLNRLLNESFRRLSKKVEAEQKRLAAESRADA